MKKFVTLKVINPLLALVFFMTAGGGILRLLAPDMIAYDLFRAVHPKLGMILVVLVFVHVVLNAKWIKSTYFKK